MGFIMFHPYRLQHTTDLHGTSFSRPQLRFSAEVPSATSCGTAEMKPNASTFAGALVNELETA